MPFNLYDIDIAPIFFHVCTLIRSDILTNGDRKADAIDRIDPADLFSSPHNTVFPLDLIVRVLAGTCSHHEAQTEYPNHWHAGK